MGEGAVCGLLCLPRLECQLHEPMTCFCSWPIPPDLIRHVVGILSTHTVSTLHPLKVPAHPTLEEQTQTAIFVISSETKQPVKLKAAGCKEGSSGL